MPGRNRVTHGLEFADFPRESRARLAALDYVSLYTFQIARAKSKQYEISELLTGILSGLPEEGLKSEQNKMKYNISASVIYGESRHKITIPFTLSSDIAEYNRTVTFATKIRMAKSLSVPWFISFPPPLRPVAHVDGRGVCRLGASADQGAWCAAPTRKLACKSRDTERNITDLIYAEFELWAICFSDLTCDYWRLIVTHLLPIQSQALMCTSTLPAALALETKKWINSVAKLKEGNPYYGVPRSHFCEPLIPKNRLTAKCQSDRPLSLCPAVVCPAVNCPAVVCPAVVCPSVCLTVYTSIRLPDCLFVYPLVCLFVYPLVCLSVCLSIRPNSRGIRQIDRRILVFRGNRLNGLATRVVDRLTDNVHAINYGDKIAKDVRCATVVTRLRFLRFKQQLICYAQICKRLATRIQRVSRACQRVASASAGSRRGGGAREVVIEFRVCVALLALVCEWSGGEGSRSTCWEAVGRCSPAPLHLCPDPFAKVDLPKEYTDRCVLPFT
ncbi:Protein of unknown function [Gryllus bimaculatus]|nr:Protein of unknown function [Gryllus bimaculatus]